MPLAFTFEEASTLLNQLKSEHRCRRRIELEITPSLKRTLGQAKRTGSRAYLIRLSSYLSYDEMQDTLRHEFAHVMAGLRQAHGAKWKDWAMDVGAVPKPCAPQYPALTPLHTYTCPNCESHVIRRVNRVDDKRWIARPCQTPLTQFTHAYVEPTEADVPPRKEMWLTNGYLRPLL